jgi:DNA-binding CsgD family transcriptional regulator
MLLRRQDNDRLQSLITEVLSAAAAGSLASGGTMRASRPTGRRPYVIIVTPISPRYSELSAIRPVASVIVVDPEHRPTLPVERVQRAFGLTAAEARLAVQLAAGDDLRTAAANLGITYGTARVRLANVFNKTDTRRQGELIGLLLTAVGSV